MNDADWTLIAIGVGISLMSARELHDVFMVIGAGVSLIAIGFAVAFLPSRWFMHE